MRSQSLWVLFFFCVMLPFSSARRGFVEAFPDTFYVSVGTTIPFAGGSSDPVAQTGAIYVDGPGSRMRIDQFWMGSSRSFVADVKLKKGFVISNGECKSFVLRGGDLDGFGVPQGYVRDEKAATVRGVEVRRYFGVDRGEYLQEVEYFVRNVTFVLPDSVPPPGGTESEQPLERFTITMPWRIRSQRTARLAIAAAPSTMPNWRVFGGPMMDELVRIDEPFSRAMEIVHRTPVTMDFYDFVPVTPDANVFAQPLDCPWIGDSSDSWSDADSGNSEHDVLDIFSACRLLLDLSFDTAHGREVIREAMELAKDQAERNSPEEL